MLLKRREFLLGEVNHRVQNRLAIVSSFLSMQALGSEDESVRSALAEARRRDAHPGTVAILTAGRR